MGIDLAAFEFLLRAQRDVGDFGRTLTLGRQRLLLRDNASRKRFADSLAKYKPDLTLTDIEHDYVDRLIERLGGEPHFLDRSAYEGAQVIHDLNEPLPSALVASYDTVIDIGTLEHAFNIGTALKSVAEMVAEGGRFLCLNVADNHLGHGFWQFGPEAFFRTFDEGNGFEPVFADLYNRGELQPLRDPEEAGRRLPITTPGYTYIMFGARRFEVRSIFPDGWPAQADYRASWTCFLARRALQEGDPAEGERILRDAARQHPRNPLYLAELSRLIRTSSDRLSECEELTKAAQALAEDNPAVNREREAVLAALGEADAAGRVAARAPAAHRGEDAPVTEPGLPSVIDIGGVTVAFDDPRLPQASRDALRNGRYEFRERELARRLLRPADRVIELGAGMGVVSLTIARLIGAEAVLSFEANPATIELTRVNARRNRLQIALRNAIAGPRATTEPGGTIEFFTLRSFEASSTRRVSPAQLPVQVPAEILEEHIEAHGANVLVMDIEGSEREIIEQADLRRIERLAVEMHPRVMGIDGVVALVVRLESQGLRLRHDLLIRDVMAFDRSAPCTGDASHVVERTLQLDEAFRAGDIAHALELSGSLADSLAGNAYYHQRHSEILRRQGENGLPAAEAAARLGSGDFLLYAGLAEMYCDVSRFDEAEQAVRELRSLFPGSPQIEGLTARIERGRRTTARA